MLFDVRSKEYDVAAREALQYSTGIFPDSSAVLNTMQRYYNPRYGCPTLSISYRIFLFQCEKSIERLALLKHAEEIPEEGRL